jgi:hypothetical protein
MNSCVLMLEDSGERLARFAAALATVESNPRLIHWPSAPRMIREYPLYLPDARLICLDHDLDPLPGEPDPGDGLDVARHLAAARPQCPILIHSSNGDGANRMLGEFQLNRCSAFTILPLGSDWIEVFWRRRVRELLVPA